MITKEQWLELCKKYDKWCSYEEVKDCSSVEIAEIYIKTMRVFVPM